MAIHPKPKFPNKRNIEELNLGSIKSAALDYYRTLGVDPRMDSDQFMSMCWTMAVVSELNKLEIIDFVYARNHLEKIK